MHHWNKYYHDWLNKILIVIKDIQLDNFAKKCMNIMLKMKSTNFNKICS